MRKNYIAVLEIFEILEGKKQWNIHTVEFQAKDWQSALERLRDTIRDDYNEVFFVDNYRIFEIAKGIPATSAEPMYQSIEKDLLTQNFDEDE